jgi:hypothetical protein
VISKPIDYFPVYVAEPDEEAMLSFEEYGFLLRLKQLSARIGSIPDDIEVLRKRLDKSVPIERYQELWEAVRPLFKLQDSDGRLREQTVEEARDKAYRRSEIARLGGRTAQENARKKDGRTRRGNGSQPDPEPAVCNSGNDSSSTPVELKSNSSSTAVELQSDFTLARDRALLSSPTLVGRESPLLSKGSRKRCRGNLEGEQSRRIADMQIAIRDVCKLDGKMHAGIIVRAADKVLAADQLYTAADVRRCGEQLHDDGETAIDHLSAWKRFFALQDALPRFKDGSPSHSRSHSPPAIPPNLHPCKAWPHVSAMLKTVIDPDFCGSWLDHVQCLGIADDDTVYLTAPTQSDADLVKLAYGDAITEQFQTVLPGAAVRFVLRPSRPPGPSRPPAPPTQKNKTGAPEARRKKTPRRKVL